MVFSSLGGFEVWGGDLGGFGGGSSLLPGSQFRWFRWFSRCFRWFWDLGSGDLGGFLEF